jgi:hypothetical protein
LLERVRLGERDGAPAVVAAVEQPLHPLLGGVLPVEVLHLPKETNVRKKNQENDANREKGSDRPRLTQEGRQLLTKLARDFLQSAG